MPEWYSEVLRELPAWLAAYFPQDPDALQDLALRLAVALGLGCVVAGVYRETHGRANGQENGLTATLVLLTVLIAMVTLVIGDSMALAFGLVGALSIIRFRTVVEDTRDTAFVIFAVAVGMAAGAGPLGQGPKYLIVALLGIPVAALAAFLFRPRDPGARPARLDATLTVRVGTGHSPDALLGTTFGKHLKSWRLTGTATARQGAALDLTYAVRLRSEHAALGLVGDLNRTEGVQEVQLRQA